MSRNNVLEKYIIDLCSPTLASLKTASLINCYFINEKQLEKDMAELNLLLNGKGIKIQTLRKSKKSVLIYVYRIDMLAKDLMKPGVKEVLTYYGYDSTEPEKAIEKLKMRLSETTEFPHEIGLFLGYPVSLKVALRQRLRWSKGHLQAFAESGWGLFKNIFIDTHTQRYDDDKWYNYTWRTIRHRFMSFDTFAQLLPKNIINIFRWIIVYLILYPFFCSQFGLDNIRILYNSTWLAHAITHIFGDITVSLPAGAETYVLTILIEIWVRIYYRIGLYFFKTLEAVYLFIIENKRMPKISIWKKILYCFTWPTFDIIGRYTQYVALFKKVEWKPIPHKSEITIDDISQD